MHISDIEGEFVPRKGDTVSYRACPIPPRFEKLQVSLNILIPFFGSIKIILNALK